MTNSLIYYRKKLLETTEESVVSNADGDSLSNDIILNDGVNYLVLPVTPTQYKNLLSACINGVFTTFPENPIGVLYPLIKAGKVNLCDAVVDCINDPESGLSDAIVDLINSTAYDNSVSIGQGQNESVLGNGYNPTCDFDILYGQIRQLVDYLHAVNVDILEIIEVASNLLDGFAEVIGDIKGIDGSAIATGVDWLAFIQDNIAENYDAQVTTTYLEVVACDLFCIAKENCAVTPTILYDYFSDKLSNSITIEGLFDATLGYLITGAWTGSQIADFMFLSQLALRSQLGRVLDFSAYFDINTRMQIYSNDPDGDWATLCDNCDYHWEQVFDFTQELYSSEWVASNPTYPPIWITDTAIEGGRDALGCRDSARFDFPARTITFVEAEFTYQNTASNTRDSGFYGGNAGNELLIDERDFRAGSGSYNYEWNGSMDSVDRLYLKFGSRNGASSYSRCTRLTIRGLGTNPF
ncbi:MAG: hypothetical protein KJO69_06750 [Gammaproteobacteria bacterium]|nr:hypothetical protein [Gammaproteobacteria bacterium]